MTRPTLGSLSLLGAVAAYFAIGCTRSLEYIEEGQMLYPSWLVAGGAVPHEDFHHLYGPALFALNGLLLHWFGTDVFVVRLSLVVLKTLTVALTYVLTRRVAARPIALLAGAVLTAIWGTPWWVFNSPYANHYSVTLTLAGVVAFLALPRHFRAACGLAGLCFGLAATFKQTAGLFALGGFVLFLILDRDRLQRRDLPAGPPLPDWCIRSARLAVLAMMLGAFALYLSPRNSVWNVLVLFAPAAVTVAIAFARELRGPLHRGARVGTVGMFYAALAAAVPVAALALYYAVRGSLPALVFDLVLGRPQQFTWFTPFPVPNARTLGLLALVAIGFAAVELVRRWNPRAQRGRWSATALATLALAALAAGVAMRMGLLQYVGSRMWQGPIIGLWSLAPLLAIWLSAPQVLRPARSGASSAAGNSAALLVFCNAVTSVLLFYPSADYLHVFMALPPFMPLCAMLLQQFYRHAAAQQSMAGRWSAAALIGALSLMLTLPSVDHLAAVYLATRSDSTTMPHATAIHGVQPKFADVAALVSYIDAEVPANAPILVLSCESLLYMLAGRRSALEKDEFVFYMIAANIIADEDARRMVDQQAAVATLTASRPLIVEGGEPRTDGRVRTLFADLSRHLETHYEVVKTVGNYRILRWAG